MTRSVPVGGGRPDEPAVPFTETVILPEPDPLLIEEMSHWRVFEDGDVVGLERDDLPSTLVPKP